MNFNKFFRTPAEDEKKLFWNNIHENVEPVSAHCSNTLLPASYFWVEIAEPKHILLQGEKLHPLDAMLDIREWEYQYVITTIIQSFFRREFDALKESIKDLPFNVRQQSIYSFKTTCSRYLKVKP